jgi:Anti-sigma-K factor rskA
MSGDLGGADGPLDGRAAALESATATLANPAEQDRADRLRSLLAHPAVWADLPGAAAPPRPAELPTATPLAAEPRLAEPDAVEPAAVGPAVAGLPAAEPDAAGPEAVGPAVAGLPAAEPDAVQTSDGTDLTENGTGGAGAPVPLPYRSRRWNRPRTWVAAVGGLAAAAALALFVVVPAVAPDREVVRAELAGAATAPGATASMTAVRLPAGWHVTLRVEGLPGAPADTYYQGWVRRGDTYVPLGTFHLRQPGEVELWAGVTMTEYSSIVITRQRVGAGFGPGETVLTGEIHR